MPFFQDLKVSLERYGKILTNPIILNPVGVLFTSMITKVSGPAVFIPAVIVSGISAVLKSKELQNEQQGLVNEHQRLVNEHQGLENENMVLAIYHDYVRREGMVAEKILDSIKIEKVQHGDNIKMLFFLCLIGILLLVLGASRMENKTPDKDWPTVLFNDIAPFFLMLVGSYLTYKHDIVDLIREAPSLAQETATRFKASFHFAPHAENRDNQPPAYEETTRQQYKRQ